MTNPIVGFSTSNSIISKIIRWFTRSKASHAYIRYYDNTLEKCLILEATGVGYKLSNYKKWEKKNIKIIEFQCKKALNESLKFIADKLGQDYDYQSALGLALRRWFGKWYRNPFRDPKKMHCSEAVTLFLQHANLATNLDPESTTPEDLLDYCSISLYFEECNVDSNQ